MEKIKLLSSDTIYNCKLNSIKIGVFKISIDAPTSLSHEIFSDGFYLLNEHNNSVMGNYSDYTVLYKESEENENNVFYISNGEVYIEHETNTDAGNASNDTQVELTEEEKIELERNNKIYSIQLEINDLKSQLAETDYIVIKCQEYELAGKDLPDEYDIIKFSEERDSIRKQINELEAKLSEI